MLHFRNISIEGRALPEDVDPKDWNVDRYEQAVLALLRQLDASKVGQIVFTFIDGDIVIKPLSVRLPSRQLALKRREPSSA